METQYFPVFLQILIAIGFVVVVLGLSAIITRTKTRNKGKDSAYECGIPPEGEASTRFSVKFYLVGMLFVLFDIEVVFMFPWAVQFRDLVMNGNPTALISLAGFAGILLFGYIYVFRKGVFNWSES